LLAPSAAQVVLVGANCAVIVLAAGTAWRALGSRGRRLVVLALVSASVALATEAVHVTVYLGQINLVLLAAVLWDLLRPDTRGGKGALLGVAAGVKLTPLIFVLYLVATKRFRAAGLAIGAFLGTVAVGFVLLPGDSTRFWVGGTFAEATRVFPDPAAVQNQSLHGLILRQGGSPTLWALLAVAVVAGTVAVAAWASRRGEELLALVLCGLCAATVSPWSWGHHWVWLLPLGILLASQVIPATLRPHHAVWLLPAVLMTLTFPPLLAFAVPAPGTGPPTLGAGPVAFVLGNVYVLIFASTLTGTVVHLLSTAATPVPVMPAPAAGTKTAKTHAPNVTRSVCGRSPSAP
jgi:alpha-1,2-mannosyltransferase